MSLVRCLFLVMHMCRMATSFVPSAIQSRGIARGFLPLDTTTSTIRFNADSDSEIPSVISLDSATPGCFLISPSFEYNHFLMEQVVLLYEHFEDGGNSYGVILERPTAFNVPEMIPGLDEFADNYLFTGGEDGQDSAVLMLHTQADLPGARAVGGSGGLMVGGVQAARAAVAAGDLPSTAFKFFFGRVTLSPLDLKGMLKDGGWRCVTLADSAAIPSAVLKNQITAPLWESLRRRLAKIEGVLPE